MVTGSCHVTVSSVDRLHEPGIQVLDGFYLEGYVALVSRFIAGFNVQVNEVVFFQRRKSRRCLPLVVGVVEARGPAATFTTSSPAYTPIPRIRSTAEITAPLPMGNSSFNGFMEGRKSG